MSVHDGRAVHAHVPGPGEPSVPEIEVDETIPPRPEEEIADVARARPDVSDHSRHPDSAPEAGGGSDRDEPPASSLE